MIEPFMAMIIGLGFGVFTGLAPGIHSNLVTTLLISLFPTISFLSPFAAAIFVITLAMTHTLVEFIPTIFLNAPEEDAFLSLLPGQQLLLEGRGYEAIALLVFGSLLGLAATLLITPLYLIALPLVYGALVKVIPYLLIALSCYLIARESRPLPALAVFISAALLGLLTFRLPIREPLLPLLTGLFGLSSMIAALSSTKIPCQNTTILLRQILPSKREWGKAAAATLISAPLCSCLPGIGAGHAATLGSEIVPQNNRSFLLLVGALATAVMALSFVTVYAIARARSGAAAAVQQLLQPFTFPQLALTIMLILFVGIVSASLTLYLARNAATILNRVNYRTLSYMVVAFLIVLVFVISTPLSLIVLFTGAAIGIVCIQRGARRINLMAALIVPAIVFYMT